MRSSPLSWKHLSLCAVLLVASSARAEDRPLEFHLTFSPTVSEKPFTGRVYVMLSKNEVRNLRSGPNWFSPEPFFALDVKDWKPGEVLVVDKKAPGYPSTLDKVAAGVWSAQAVMDFDRGNQHFSTAEGNGY